MYISLLFDLSLYHRKQKKKSETGEEIPFFSKIHWNILIQKSPD